MLVLRRGTVSLVALALAFAAMSAVARADDAGVKATIMAQGHAIRQNPQVKRLLNGTINSKNVPETIKLCRTLATKLRHAGDIVAKTTASTPEGRAGKTNWVRGVRGLAHGFSQLATALTDQEHGDKKAANTEAIAALKTVTKAEVLGNKADKQLKLYGA